MSRARIAGYVIQQVINYIAKVLSILKIFTIFAKSFTYN